MDHDIGIKLAIYRHFAETAARPSAGAVARRSGSTVEEVLAAYPRLEAQRVLKLEEDGVAIRMAPPFSGVPTQHITEIGGKSYFANCAWDSLGIAAALGRPAVVHSRCEQSHEPLRLEVDVDGPEASAWLFHSLVPAAHWWDDIVFT